MQIAKTNLTKNPMAMFSAAALIVVALYIFLYHPLLKKFNHLRLTCQKLESEAGQSYKKAEFLKGVAAEKKILGEGELDEALGELKQQAQFSRIRLVSLIPRAIDQREAAYKIMPLAIVAESSFKRLAMFLESLRTSVSPLVTVRSLKVAPQNNNAEDLQAEILLNLYLKTDAPLIFAASDLKALAKDKKSAYSAWVRNPFMRSGSDSEGGLKLNGIFYDQATPLAIVNNRVVRKNEKLNGYTVVDIQEDKVILNDGTKNLELHLGR